MQEIRSYKLIFLSALLLLLGCSDPVTPEFNYIDEIIYIEALASTSPGISQVTVNTSVTEFGVRKVVFIDNALVTFRNTGTGEQINLMLQEDAYVPPSDFVVQENETWEMHVALSDGRQFQSQPEKVTNIVEISEINATYSPELFFSDAQEGFVPGHGISVSFNDPANEANYYFWRFKSFEPIILCGVCYEGTYFRNGECRAFEGYTLVPFFTYACNSPCWQIRYNENIQIFADEFSNGAAVNNISVANIPLYTKENIAVEIQQLSLTADAYQYYKALKDIINNSGSFNAPPPAALIGNLFNPNDSNEVVLGRFTVAASSTKSIFLDRSGIEEAPLEVNNVIFNDEGGIGVDTPFPDTLAIPCEESRYRTGVTPEAWVDID